MSATSIGIPGSRPASRRPAFLGAFPTELSKSPLLGIVGVILGAGIVTLTAVSVATSVAR